MDRIATYAPNQIVTSTQLNAIQDLAVGSRPADVGNNLSTMSEGERVIHWESATDVADGTIAILDDADWSDYIIDIALNAKANTLAYIGGTNDDVWAAGTTTRALGYLGKGAKHAGVQVTAGNPPILSAGLSWAAQLAGVWVYVDPYDSKLKIYNESGFALLTPYLRIAGALTNKRP
jgi:hypothetical protein